MMARNGNPIVWVPIGFSALAGVVLGIVLLSASGFTPNISTAGVRFGCNGCRTYYNDTTQAYTHAFNTTIGTEPFDCETGDGCHFALMSHSCGWYHEACPTDPGGGNLAPEEAFATALEALETSQYARATSLLAEYRQLALNAGRGALQLLDCGGDHVVAHAALSPATLAGLQDAGALR